MTTLDFLTKKLLMISDNFLKVCVHDEYKSTLFSYFKIIHKLS